jgi:hypothetical protein
VPEPDHLAGRTLRPHALNRSHSIAVVETSDYSPCLLSLTHSPRSPTEASVASSEHEHSYAVSTTKNAKSSRTSRLKKPRLPAPFEARTHNPTMCASAWAEKGSLPAARVRRLPRPASTASTSQRCSSTCATVPVPRRLAPWQHQLRRHVWNKAKPAADGKEGGATKISRM